MLEKIAGFLCSNGWIDETIIMEDYYPQGFRFFPTEEELLCFYLKHKLQGDREDIDAVIPVVNIYDHCPWDLPQLVGELCRGDPEECFFFVDMQENISRGGKPSRLTPEGYWKAAGTPTLIYSNNEIIGGKRTMIFYRGRAPTGRKTEWKMIEYKAILGETPPTATTISDVQLRHELSLCRIYKTARLDRGFDRRPPSAPAAIAVPQAIAEPPFPHLQTVPQSIAAQPSSSNPQVIPELSVENSSSQNNFWDVCVPLWDWEGMRF